jgi:nitrogen regulatory protein PII
MTEIRFILTTENAKKVTDALCNNYNYQETITSIDAEKGTNETISNSEKKEDFAKRMIINFMKEHVQAYAINVAKEAAIKAASVSIDIE